MIFKQKDIAVAIRGGADIKIRELYNEASELINTELWEGFVEKGLSEVTVDMSELKEGLNFFQICKIHGELLIDAQHNGWKVETYPFEHLKFTFTAPVGSF